MWVLFLVALYSSSSPSIRENLPGAEREACPPSEPGVKGQSPQGDPCDLCVGTRDEWERREAEHIPRDGLGSYCTSAKGTEQFSASTWNLSDSKSHLGLGST